MDIDSYWIGGGRKGSNKKKNKGTKNKFDHPTNAPTSASQQVHKKQKRAHVTPGFVNLGYGLVDESSSLVFSTTKVQGQCQTLEKSYLRLTSAADPALVRSPQVLQQALTMVKRKWIDTQE